MTTNVHIKWLNWVVVLTPMSNLRGGPETEEFYTALKSAWAESYQGIVVNLSEVRVITSTGIGVLLDYRQQATRTGTKFALCSLSQKLEWYFALCGVGRSFKTFESEEEAIRYCSQR